VRDLQVASALSNHSVPPPFWHGHPRPRSAVSMSRSNVTPSERVAQSPHLREPLALAAGARPSGRFSSIKPLSSASSLARSPSPPERGLYEPQQCDAIRTCCSISSPWRTSGPRPRCATFRSLPRGGRSRLNRYPASAETPERGRPRPQQCDTIRTCCSISLPLRTSGPRPRCATFRSLHRDGPPRLNLYPTSAETPERGRPRPQQGGKLRACRVFSDVQPHAAASPPTVRDLKVASA